MDMSGVEFSRSIRKLVSEDRLKDATDILSLYKDQANREIQRIRQAERAIEAVGEISARTYEHARKIVLTDFAPSAPVRLDNIDDVLSNPFGSYVFGEDVERASTFEDDLRDLDPDTRDRLRDSGFAINITSSNQERIEIINGAVICAEDTSILACSTYDGRYIREACSAKARSTRVNFRRTPKQFIDRAIVLPAPYSVWNYYHTMTESAYYLRFAAHNDAPIIAPPDHFGIIAYVAKQLGINSNRFITYEMAREAYIRKAALIVPGGFYWSTEAYRFFRDLPSGTGGARKIYLSRSLSGRGPENEKEIEAAVSKMGFAIVHAEKISVAEQADLFSGVEFIIAPHGAGLSNLLYTQPGTKLIEIFDKAYLFGAFYLRSANNRMPYHPILFEGRLPVEQIEAGIRALSDRHQPA